MTTCTYSFTGADGEPTVITGKAAFKAFLLDGGLQQLLPNFGPQALDLNAKLEQKIFSDFDKAVGEYSALPDTKGGKLLDTDQARELSPEYRADRSLAPKVHEAASAFTQRAFEQRMAEAPDGGLVLFMAGGGGAGKSSAEDLLSADMDRANTILDGTLSSYDKAAKNIQLALDNNQSVRIVYVYREPVEAMRNGVLTRAMKRGRTVTIDAVVKGHAGSSEVVRKLQTEFGDNPNFLIKVIDNSRGPNGAVVSSLGAVPVVERQGLKEKLQNATDEEFKAGRISDVVHKTTTAPYDTRQGDGSAGQGQSVRPGAGRDVQGRRELGGAQYSVRTETPNFKRWFGDSKVVDDNGDPLVVYHATTSDIGAFSLRKSRGGFYFTPSAKDAYPSQRGTMSSDRGLNVMPVYLSIKNPFVTSDPKDWHALDAAGRKRIEKLGHDGVVVANSDGSVREYVAFDPTQIKSATGNTGEFSPTNSSIIASQRTSQKNPAASRVGNESASRFERTEALKQGVSDLQEGKITQDEYNRMVDELRPVYPYEAVPAITTKAEATYALANGRGQSEEKAAKYGLPNKELKAGDFAQLRLDIPSYQNHDAWVVSVHTPKSTNTAVQAAYDAGPVIGYESVAAITDAYFGMNQKVAARIATGTAKGTIATVFGKWKPISAAAAKVRADAAIKDPAWTQVGMDPFRHSYFYDRDTMRPVLQADEVIQIGPLVLAKNATFSEDNMDVTGSPILFSQRTTETPNFKRWFGDSKVVDENGDPLVVYHGTLNEFEAFLPSDVGTFGAGIYFGGTEDANAYADSRSVFDEDEVLPGQVMPVYLSLQNPLVVDVDPEVGIGQSFLDAIPRPGVAAMFDPDEDFDNEITNQLKNMGFDGIVVNYVDGHEYVAFRPTQIKSATGNTGAFDPENPSILMSQRTPTQGRVYTLQGETRAGSVQRAMQDYFARVRNVQEAIAAQGGTVGEAQNVYLAEELSYGRMQEQLQDFKDDMVIPLIKEVKAAGLELSDLALYSYARHAPERNLAIAAKNKTFGKGEGSGMSTIESENIIKAFRAEGKEDALKGLHEKLLAITQATRLVMLDEGLISQDEFDAWQSQYSDYVPLRGFAEDEDLLTGQPVSTPRVSVGRGFNIRGKESVRALGRETRAGHIIENILADYERAIARAERNSVAKVFLDLVTTNPDPGLWEIDAERTKASFDRASGMVQYNTLIDKGEDTISVKIAGKEVYIKIKDPMLLRAMRNASKDETGALDRVLASSIGLYTTLLRNTLTRYNPAFGFVNAVKDVGFGAVSALADLGPKGMALYLKNYANPVQSGPMFEEFRAAGSTTGGWHMRDQQEMQKELQRLVKWQGSSDLKAKSYAAAKGTLEALEFIGQYSETQARFAAYKAARELGRSPAEAASIAKNLTTNFNRKGEWGSTMNTMYLFYNAGVQGSAKTIKNLKSPYVMAAMTGLAGLSAGLAFMAAGVGGEDDDGEAYWDKIPQFEKERNLIIMLPPGKGMQLTGVSTVGKNGRYLKLPIQYGLNVFSTFGYQVADLARYAGDRTRGVSPSKAAINMTSVVFGAFNPFGGGFNVTKPVEVAMAVSPSVVDLGIQALMGVNSFGRPVAPRKYNDEMPDSENFGPGMAGTWEQRLARWLSTNTGGDRAVGGAVDVSPGSIRNIVKNLTGGTGDFLSAVFVNIPSKMWSPDGALGPRDVPVLKAFYGEVDDITDSSLFYERKAEVMTAAKQAADRQKLGIEITYDPESKGLQSLGNAAKYYTKQMTRVRKEELRVADDPNLTDAQKNAERKVLQKERAELASEFNAEYFAMKKDLAAGKFGK